MMLVLLVLQAVVYYVIRFHLLPKVMSASSLDILDMVMFTILSAVSFAGGSVVTGILCALITLWSGYTWYKRG